MFEEYTEEYLMGQAQEMGQALGVDTRQGSVYMDACTGHVMRVAKFYEDLRMAFSMFSDASCMGEVLEEKASQRLIHRKQATPSYYEAQFQGVPAAELEGDRFMADGHYFTLVPYDGSHYLEAEEPGSGTSHIPEGQTLIPVRNTAGLVSAKVGRLYVAGSDMETDDSLRSRYQDALSLPAENGNRQQYKVWCEDYEGIGRAVITPLGRGENTVVALLISSEGAVPPTALVEKIQGEIDPGSAGLGEGKALIGCHFYAVAAKGEALDVSLAAEISPGHTAESAAAMARRELAAYLKEVALGTEDGEPMVIQYVKVVGMLAGVPAIKDFSGLTINGAAENVTVAEGCVGILGEVEIHGSV